MLEQPHNEPRTATEQHTPSKLQRPSKIPPYSTAINVLSSTGVVLLSNVEYRRCEDMPEWCQCYDASTGELVSDTLVMLRTLNHGFYVKDCRGNAMSTAAWSYEIVK